MKTTMTNAGKKALELSPHSGYKMLFILLDLLASLELKKQEFIRIHATRHSSMSRQDAIRRRLAGEASLINDIISSVASEEAGGAASDADLIELLSQDHSLAGDDGDSCGGGLTAFIIIKNIMQARLQETAKDWLAVVHNEQIKGTREQRALK